MHLANTFYSTLYGKYRFYKFFAFPKNQTQNLAIASSMLYYLSYRKANWLKHEGKMGSSHTQKKNMMLIYSQSKM